MQAAYAKSARCRSNLGVTAIHISVVVSRKVSSAVPSVATEGHAGQMAQSLHNHSSIDCGMRNLPRIIDRSIYLIIAELSYAIPIGSRLDAYCALGVSV